MGIAAYRLMDSHIAAPSGSSARVGSSEDIRRSSLPRRGVPLRATPRTFFRWLRVVASSPGARSQRFSSSLSPRGLDAISGDRDVPYPSQMAALGRVVARVVESQR